MLEEPSKENILVTAALVLTLLSSTLSSHLNWLTMSRGKLVPKVPTLKYQNKWNTSQSDLQAVSKIFRTCLCCCTQKHCHEAYPSFPKMLRVVLCTSPETFLSPLSSTCLLAHTQDYFKAITLPCYLAHVKWEWVGRAHWTVTLLGTA